MEMASIRHSILNTSTGVGGQVFGPENCESSHDTRCSSRARVIADSETELHTQRSLNDV
jgi:hypothetical protein